MYLHVAVFFATDDLKWTPSNVPVGCAPALASIAANVVALVWSRWMLRSAVDGNVESTSVTTWGGLGVLDRGEKGSRR